jgi:hypothetical protein
VTTTGAEIMDEVFRKTGTGLFNQTVLDVLLSRPPHARNIGATSPATDIVIHCGHSAGGLVNGYYDVRVMEGHSVCA